MPRKPRFYVPGVPVHLIQRGNNRQTCFFAEEVKSGRSHFREHDETKTYTEMKSHKEKGSELILKRQQMKRR